MLIIDYRYDIAVLLTIVTIVSMVVIAFLVDKIKKRDRIYHNQRQGIPYRVK